MNLQIMGRCLEVVVGEQFDISCVPVLKEGGIPGVQVFENQKEHECVLLKNVK
jgi:hypothetical protein